MDLLQQSPAHSSAQGRAFSLLIWLQSCKSNEFSTQELFDFKLIEAWGFQGLDLGKDFKYAFFTNQKIHSSRGARNLLLAHIQPLGLSFCPQDYAPKEVKRSLEVFLKIKANPKNPKPPPHTIHIAPSDQLYK